MEHTPRWKGVGRGVGKLWQHMALKCGTALAEGAQPAAFTGLLPHMAAVPEQVPDVTESALKLEGQVIPPSYICAIRDKVHHSK